MKYLLNCLLLSLFLLTSCTSIRQRTFAVGANQNMALSDYPEFTIQEGDEIFVYVSALDERAAKPFNSPYPYYVGKQGMIQMPMLDSIYVLGLTLEKTKNLVLELLADKIQKPFVKVTFANAFISILGEVKSPQQLSVVRPITIFEALGAANGLTRNACCTKIEVLRTEDKEVKKNTVDLTSPDIVNSPCYYLIKGDVVNVRPLHSVITK